MEKVKVAWAFDPYSDMADTWLATLDFVEKVRGTNKEWVVYPMYVLGQEMVHWVSNVTPPQLELVQPKVEEYMRLQVSSLQRSELAAPRVIISEGFNSRNDIEAFNKELQQLQPDFVVMNTHQRKGLTRLFMGSFTENFLLKSQFPTLILPPDMKGSAKLTKTLLPSSFADKEKEFYTDFVSGKMGFASDVILYSKVFHPIDAFATSTATVLGGSWVSIEAFSQEVITHRLKKGEQWAAEAPQGVTVKVRVDDKPQDFADSLLQVAKEEGAELIALPSFTGKAEAIFLGSNAREVIRQSSLPVLVRHYPNP